LHFQIMSGAAGDILAQRQSIQPPYCPAMSSV